MRNHPLLLAVIFLLLVASAPLAHAQAEIVVQDDGSTAFGLAILVFFAGLFFWRLIFGFFDRT